MSDDVSVDPDAARAYWELRARRLRAQLNFALWLGALAPWLALGASVASGAVVLARAELIGAAAAAAVAAAAISAALVGAGLRLRGAAYSIEDARARLDRLCSLNDRLSSAAEGVASWPSPARAATRSDGSDVSRIRLRRRAWLAPAAALAAPLAVAVLVPLGSDVPAARGEVMQPLAWLEVDAALAALEQQPAIDEAALAEMRAKLDALRSRPAESWYEHGSLEAADALREQVQRSLETLARSVRDASRALDALERAGTAGEDSGAAADRVAAALEELGRGSFPLSADARRELSQAAASGKQDPTAAAARQASADQQRRMLENLEIAAGEAARAGGLPELVPVPAALDAPGLARGPGPAPLVLAEEPSELSATQSEGITGDALDRAVPLDAVAERAVRPDPDAVRAPAPGDGERGGSPAGAGQGAEATWEITLPPADRDVLERYFR